MQRHPRAASARSRTPFERARRPYARAPASFARRHPPPRRRRGRRSQGAQGAQGGQGAQDGQGAQNGHEAPHPTGEPSRAVGDRSRHARQAALGMPVGIPPAAPPGPPARSRLGKPCARALRAAQPTSRASRCPDRARRCMPARRGPPIRGDRSRPNTDRLARTRRLAQDTRTAGGPSGESAGPRPRACGWESPRPRFGVTFGVPRDAPICGTRDVHR